MKRRSLCLSLILLTLSAGAAFAGEGPAALYESALAAAEAGRGDAARRGFERLIRYYPHHVFGRRAYLDLAQLHLEARRPALALRTLDEASASPHASAALKTSCRAWRELIEARSSGRRSKAPSKLRAKAPSPARPARRPRAQRSMPRIGLTVGQIQALERVLDKREEDLEKAVIEGDSKEVDRLTNIIARLERRLVQMLNDFDPKKAAPPAPKTHEDPELLRLNRALQKAFDALEAAHEKGDADTISRINREVTRLEAALGLTLQDTDGMKREGYPRGIAIERAASAAEITRLEAAVDQKLEAFDVAHNAGKLDKARAIYDEVVALERQLHRVLEGGWADQEDDDDRAERREAEDQASRRLRELEDRIERQRTALDEAVERGETRRLEALEKQLEELEDQVEALLEGRSKPTKSRKAPAKTIAPKAPQLRAEARPAAQREPRGADEGADELRELLEDMRAEAKTLRAAGEFELAGEVEAEIQELSKSAQGEAAPARPAADEAPPRRLRPLPPRPTPGVEERLSRVERGLETMTARLEELLKRLDTRRL